MRIVITGASGNIGSALLRRLEADGGHDLVGIARRPPGTQDSPYGLVDWVPIDLTDPASGRELARTFVGAGAVVHLAWGFQPSHDLDYLERLGVGGTRRVLEAVTAAGVPHLVHMSSVGAYSPKEDDARVDESWPTGGVQSSPYSRHKSTAERLLDEHEAHHPDTVVTRMRPGIVGQGEAGSSLLRYAVPAIVPASAVGLVPVVPLDPALVVPVVHSDDVADAIARALEGRVPGPFNLAAEPPITAALIADALGARLLPVPSGLVRAAVSLSWHARLQQVDPGWVDMGFSLPLLDTARAERELGWSPTTDARSVLDETITGMREGWAGKTAVLRPRSVAGQLERMVRRGPVSGRPRP